MDFFFKVIFRLNEIEMKERKDGLAFFCSVCHFFTWTNETTLKTANHSDMVYDKKRF